jgi:uroporphyrin-III C-methyltransferase/precorrin-2 dehydrogenase/sirohydrochlorin ferrochelatase
MKYYPAFMNLTGRPVLLVGGGEPAARKLRLLLKAGARVTAVAPRITTEIAELAETGAKTGAKTGSVTLRRRRFRPADLEGQGLVIGATGLPEVDAEVSRAAEAAGLAVNIVDRPELSTFITPAIVDRDPVVIGISTGGAAPVLARRIRATIEALLPSRLGQLASFAESFRSAIAGLVPDGRSRRAFWDAFFDGPIARSVLTGNERAARETMLSLVNRRGSQQAPEGSVAIVGAGPGDPDLLTLRALTALQNADVVVYDRLIGPEILDRSRRDAERIYVCKAKGDHAASQDEINDLLLDHARSGKRVVRLKGGDPFIFGRGGEEVEHLRRHGIAVELVPGITAATASAASAGIPLTHRGLAQAVTLVTGHGAEGEPDVDWAALAGGNHTLAIYMGLSNAGRVAERLIAGGRAPGTPVAVVSRATLPDQRIEIGRLGELESLVRDRAIEGPALILIGEVVALADAAAQVDAVVEALPLRAAAG